MYNEVEEGCMCTYIHVPIKCSPLHVHVHDSCIYTCKYECIIARTCNCMYM